MITVEIPPIINVDNYLENLDSESGNNIHFYLDFEYLPIRNISTIMKSVNELYELVYFILNDENVPVNDMLILNYAATGNSFDWIAQVLNTFTSKEAKIAILLTVAIIYTPIGIEKYRTDEANRNLIEAKTQLTESQTEKTKAEKQKIDLENLYKKNNLKQDSIAKLNSEKNKKSIMRKRSSIRRAAEHPAINICLVNNINIFH